MVKVEIENYAVIAGKGEESDNNLCLISSNKEFFERCPIIKNASEKKSVLVIDTRTEVRKIGFLTEYKDMILEEAKLICSECIYGATKKTR